MAGKPLPKSWQDAIKEAGSEDQAAIDYPTLDPRYQADVKKEGKAKGIEEYSHDVIDPATGANSPGIMGLMGQAGLKEYEQGLQDLRQQGGLIPTAIADVGGVLDAGGKALEGQGPVNTALFGGGAPAAPAAGTTKKPTTTTGGGTTVAPPSAAETLMNSLVSQYQAGMATVDPYIGGSNAAGFASQAQAMGQGIAGGGVQGQNPATAAVLGKDAQAVQKATDAGAKGIQEALKGTGAADQAFLQVSPYMGILNALTSEAQYKTETGSPPTSITGTAMPPWLAQAYQNTVGASPAGGAAAVGGPLTPNPNTSQTTPSSSTPSSAGGGNG